MADAQQELVNQPINYTPLSTKEGEPPLGVEPTIEASDRIEIVNNDDPKIPESVEGYIKERPQTVAVAKDLQENHGVQPTGQPGDAFLAKVLKLTPDIEKKAESEKMISKAIKWLAAFLGRQDRMPPIAKPA